MSTKGHQEPPPPPSTTYYHPLPPDPNPQQSDPHYILLPYQPNRYHRHHHHYRHLKQCLISFTSLILIIIALFILWPSKPSLRIVRLHLKHVRFHTSPIISLDISMALTVKVHNRDFFSFDYKSLVVSIGYRGRKLGLVESSSGFVRARGSSYVNATLVLNGIEVLHDVFYLLEDLAKGLIPFDTVTEVRGDLGVLLFDVPIKAKISCQVEVNTKNETVMRQDCYPE